LLRAEKLVKKARKAHLLGGARSTVSQIEDGKKVGRGGTRPSRKPQSKTSLARKLFALTQEAQHHGWSAEELLSDEIKRRERELRQREKRLER
jgi:hypothetical protein